MEPQHGAALETLPLLTKSIPQATFSTLLAGTICLGEVFRSSGAYLPLRNLALPLDCPYLSAICPFVLPPGQLV